MPEYLASLLQRPPVGWWDLLDIAVVKEHLDQVVARFENKMLNDLPELAGGNPGLEPFARVLGEALARGLVPALPPGTLTALTVPSPPAAARTSGRASSARRARAGSSAGAAHNSTTRSMGAP